MLFYCKGLLALTQVLAVMIPWLAKDTWLSMFLLTPQDRCTLAMAAGQFLEILFAVCLKLVVQSLSENFILMMLEPKSIASGRQLTRPSRGPLSQKMAIMEHISRN